MTNDIQTRGGIAGAQRWGSERMALLSRLLAPLVEHAPQVITLFATVIAASMLWAGASPGLLAIPVAFISGGFFSWFAKSFVFRAVMKEELSDLLDDDHRRQKLSESVVALALDSAMQKVYSQEHLRSYGDLDNLWKNASIAKGLPSAIAQDSLQSLMSKLWDADRPYFFERLTRTHRLSWADKPQGIVQVRTEFRGRLFNARPEAGFSFKTKVTQQASPRLSQVPTLHRFHVDLVCAEHGHARPQLCSWNKNRFNDEGSLAFSVDLPLPAEAEFEVDVAWSYAQDVDIDNVVIFEARNFIRSLTVNVEYDPTEMTVVFRELGCDEYDPRPESETAERPIVRVSPGLIIPWNGYILQVYRKPPVEGDGASG